MPKLKRLSGKEVLKILRGFGFEAYTQKGSHIKMRRITETGKRQNIMVAVHGSKTLKTGTLRSIYRSASHFIAEDELYPHFYAD